MTLPPIRFILIGGFLGSGKTTAVLRLARQFAEAGRRVGIITNDQSDRLVDTETVRTAGFSTEEIPHGCFCCKFDELVAAAGRLADGMQPDVLLAEPVGSCTDLVATVIKPLNDLYADRFSVAPYVALLDPRRARAALTSSGPAGLSAKVTYLFKMQQHEADIVAVNKIDTLDPAELDALLALVQRNFPKADVIAVSARSGQGFDDLATRLAQPPPAGRHGVNVDYDIYAEGEARLGWVNASVQLDAEQEFDADRLLLGLLSAIRRGLAASAAEPAHVKVILRSGETSAIANLVSGDRPAELSQACGRRLNRATLLVNARVEIAPEALREQVEAAVGEACREQHVDAVFFAVEALAPAPPTPTHRLPSP